MVGEREDIQWTKGRENPMTLQEDILFLYADRGCSATEDWKGNTATGMNDRH